jgi:hypothetical protein
MTEDESTDLAHLWQEALADFKGSTKIDLTQWQFTSMRDAMNGAQQQKVKFDDWRHDKGKIDYVRSLLGNNLNNIQKVVTGKETEHDRIGLVTLTDAKHNLQAQRWQQTPQVHFLLHSRPP